MGFLQAYGESNAGQTFSDVMRNVAGVAEAGMKVQEMNRKARLEDAYLNIQQAEEGRKAKAAADAEAQANKFYPASFFFGAEPTPSQQELLKVASDSGFAENIGGTIGMRAKNFKPFMELLNTRPHLAANIARVEINDLNGKIAQARTNIAAIPEGEKRAQAEAELAGLLGKLQAQTDAYTSLVKSSPEFIEKAALAEGKGSNVKGFNPDTKRPVVEDSKGNLWEDGKPYTGGPLSPATTSEPAGAADDRKYRSIIMKGNSATPEETSWAKAYEKQKTLGPAMRAEVFNAVPTSTPGVFFRRSPPGFFEIDEKGNQREISSAEAKQRKLQFIEETPTSDIKVMRQAVPSVLDLSGKSLKIIKQEMNNLGPAQSRWRELWTGKIGTEDKQFTKLRTNIMLLETRLMKMHVGSRGGEYIMKHFQDLLAFGKQSPENMISALDEIESYAREVGLSQVGGSSIPTPGTSPPSPGGAGSGAKFKILKVE